MKEFFAQYGVTIVAGALVTTGLMFTTPLGEAVADSEAGFVSGMAEKVDESMDNVTIGVSESLPSFIDGTNVTLTDTDSSGTVSKGDTITFAASYLYSEGNTGPTEFLVMSSNGITCDLFSLSNYGSNCFNEIDITTIDNNGNEIQKYEGSTLDILLNETYYNSLSDDVKSKIQPKNISQSTVKGNLSSGDINVYRIGDTIYPYRFSITGKTAEYSRNVYALDVQDIVDFLGTDIAGESLNNLVFGTEMATYQYAWLRSALEGTSGSAFYINGESGTFNGRVHYYYGGIRPAFNLSLN